MVVDGLTRKPLDGLMRTAPADPMALAAALAGAAAAIARLDQALAGHPLARAFLHRSRLDLVRRQAAADGRLIDPWHLAAVIEGLRLRMDPYLRIIDRIGIQEAARAALTLHQWLVEPDFDQEGEVQRAAAMLALQPASLPPLIAGAEAFRSWIERGEARPAMRAALIRFWVSRRLLRLPVPLTGAAALVSGSWEPEDWRLTFLGAIEREAAESLDLLMAMERAWFEARQGVTGHRRDSHVTAAVDLLAAAPVISATTLARILGIAVKSAIRILDALQAGGIAIEVTHRAKRRLFGLQGLTPLRDGVRPPYRPEPGRGRGRPRHDVREDGPDDAPPPLPPLTPVERRAFDYTALEEAMAQLDGTVRDVRRKLAAMTRGAGEDAPEPPRLHPVPHR